MVTFTAQTTYAQDLRELSESQVYRDIDESAGRATRPWLHNGSNFSSIFLPSPGPTVLATWLGDAGLGWKRKSYGSAIRQDSNQLEMSYLSLSDGAVINVRVLVPPPEYAEQVKLGLVASFRELLPPTLAISKERAITIQGISGRAFDHTHDGGCSLVVPLPKSALIQLSTRECAHQEKLIALLGRLNLTRLIEKLKS